MPVIPALGRLGAGQLRGPGQPGINSHIHTWISHNYVITWWHNVHLCLVVCDQGGCSVFLHHFLSQVSLDLNWLVSELQGSTCLLPTPITWVTGIYHCARISKIRTQVFLLVHHWLSHLLNPQYSCKETVKMCYHQDHCVCMVCTLLHSCHLVT